MVLQMRRSRDVFGAVWWFPSMGGTQNRWLISWKIQLNWMISGYPDFRKPPYGKSVNRWIELGPDSGNHIMLNMI